MLTLTRETKQHWSHWTSLSFQHWSHWTSLSFTQFSLNFGQAQDITGPPLEQSRTPPSRQGLSAQGLVCSPTTGECLLEPLGAALEPLGAALEPLGTAPCLTTRRATPALGREHRAGQTKKTMLSQSRHVHCTLHAVHAPLSRPLGTHWKLAHTCGGHT